MQRMRPGCTLFAHVESLELLMNVPRHPRRAFTIIELLVVIAIIALLVGIILPALSGVHKRSKKTVELNNLKNLGHAWMLYSNNNNDAALPGYLDSPVQMPQVIGVSRGWGVKYQFADKKTIPIDPNNLAGPWTWRLISYLDFAHDPIHSYKPDDDEFAMLAASSNLAEAKSIAYEPAYGYNGLYVGGYWEMQDVNGVQTPRYRYFSDKDTQTGARLVIPTTVSQVSRSSDVVTFCSSSHFNTIGPQRHLPDDRAGSHLVTAPTIGTTPQWQNLALDTSVLETLAGCDAPFGRFTGNPVVVYADGHVDNITIGALNDQRKWINSAERRDYTHAP
jgi:prepilin-type N-terminal cleavage/methylation domain-containing protein